MKDRSVAFVISTPEGIGGAEKVVVSLANAAAERGWRVVCLNPFDRDAVGSAMARSLGSEMYEAMSFEPRRLYAAHKWLDSRLAAIQPDVVQAQMIHAMVLTAISKPASRSGRVVSHQHGDHFSTNGYRVRAAVDRWATRRFDKVVAVSDHVSRFLTGSYGIPADAVAMIRNGWEGDPLGQESHSSPTIVCVGNLRPEKGHAVLVKAFAFVLTRFPRAKLLLVGDGPSRPSIEESIGELGIARSVEMVGAVGSVWPYLARSDVGVLPSFNETAGIAALEAMAAGLPVVASSVGGLVEVVVPDRTGHLVPAGDPAKLAAALEDLLSDPVKARRWGEQGRVMAADRSAARMVEAYYDLYDSLLGARGR